MFRASCSVLNAQRETPMAVWRPGNHAAYLRMTLIPVHQETGMTSAATVTAALDTSAGAALAVEKGGKIVL
jgi:hypothetical protein